MRLTLPGLIPCRIEQAVYGSFPFWNRGYGILARSPGCAPEWITAFKASCQRFGERPAAVTEAEALFTQPLRDGTWMIVNASPGGRDDYGRPGTMVFHALFTSRWRYRLAGANPFNYAGLLSADWNASDIDRSLPTIDRIRQRPGSQVPDCENPLTSKIADAISAGDSVLVLSRQPIASLAMAVWSRLPSKIRVAAPLATWVYNNASQYRLVGMPRASSRATSQFGLVVDLTCAPASPLEPATLQPEAVPPVRGDL